MTAAKPSLFETQRLPASFAVRSLNRQLRLFPRFPTAGDIPQFIKTLLLQNAGGDARAITTAAIDRRRFLGIKLSHPVTKLWNKNMSGAWNMPLLPFARRPHIDNLQRPFAFI